MPTGEYPPPGDNPWEGGAAYMDVGPAGGGDFDTDDKWGDDGDISGCGVNMDSYTDEAVGLMRPAVLALIGIFGVISAFWYAREPSPVVEQPGAVAPVVAVAAPNPVVAPAPPDPRAQPAGPGHWVWIPDKGPAGWNIPGAPQH